MIVRPQNSLEQNHKKCYSTDHIECYSEPQKMWEGRPHHKKWGILFKYYYKSPSNSSFISKPLSLNFYKQCTSIDWKNCTDFISYTVNMLLKINTSKKQ